MNADGAAEFRQVAASGGAVALGCTKVKGGKAPP